MLDYELDGQGSITGIGEVEIFLHSFVSRLVLKYTQPPIKCVFSPGVKAVGFKTNHPPLPSAVTVYTWTLASTSSVGLHGV